MLFFIDWINTYFNTPKIQLTLDQELLGILGIGIFAVLIVGTIFGTVLLIRTFIAISKKVLDRRNEKETPKGVKNDAEIH